jgi:hypothetical protein
VFTVVCVLCVAANGKGSANVLVAIASIVAIVYVTDIVHICLSVNS